MTVLTTIPNGASGKDVRDTINDTITKAATGISNAATNATAIAALQSGGLPFYNGGTAFNTPGALPTGVIDNWVFISGGGAFTFPAVPSTGTHSFIVTNVGSNDITLPGLTLGSNKSVRFYGRAGTWQQFIDVSAGAVSAPVLQTLSLASNSTTAGANYSTTIVGKTNGSSVTATSSDGTTLTVSGVSVSGTFTNAGSPTITLTETLAGATGSPKQSTVTITVAGAAAQYTSYALVFTTGDPNNRLQWISDGVRPCLQDGTPLGGAVTGIFGSDDFFNIEGDGTTIGGPALAYNGDLNDRSDRRPTGALADNPRVVAANFTNATRPSYFRWVCGTNANNAGPFGQIDIYGFTSAQPTSVKTRAQVIAAGGVLAYSASIPGDYLISAGGTGTKIVAVNQSGF